MNDLPNTSASVPRNPSSDDPMGVFTGGGSGSKESESGIGTVSAEQSPLTEIGREIDVPKEVSGVGVSVHPTVIQIPKPAAQHGVQAAGSNVTVGTGQSIALPLTDDQIAVGLKQGIASSWRWLAEWCVRKLKKLHIMLKIVGGKVVEVKA